jgi:DNA mismatch repair ATPase MutL
MSSKGGSKLQDVPLKRTNTNRTTPGTSVFVKDLFYKVIMAPMPLPARSKRLLSCQWPVRRKQAPSRTSVLAAVRKSIEALALVNPQVGFTLTDLERDEPDAGRILSLRPGKERGPLDVWKRLWGEAGVEVSGEKCAFALELRSQ